MSQPVSTHHNFTLKPETLAQVAPAMQTIVDKGDLSGAVTLIWRHGEIAQLNTVGWRDIEAKLPMQRDTLFRIASMTKPITSVAIMMLLEEGRLALNDPITKWAPEFSNMRVLRDPTGPVEDSYPAPRDITIEDLLTHRAGLAYAFTSVGPIAKAYAQALDHVTAAGSALSPDEWMKALGALPLSFAPGERFHYSHCTDVLGFIVGRIAGTSLREYLQQRIFVPLGMVDTDFYVPKEKRDRAAKVYRMDSSADALVPVPFPTHDAPPEFCSGGGGLISTVDDYLKFAIMLLHKGESAGMRLLKEQTVNLMTSNLLTDAQRDIPFMGFPYWAGQGFGLGVSMIMDPDVHAWMGQGRAGAFGWPGAFGTWWQADPQEDMVLLYLVQNSMPLGPEMAAQLATGQRLGARVALPSFQRLAYAALRD